MSAARIFSLVASPLVLASTGAAAQEAIPYDSGEYEYAEPLDASENEPDAPVLFRERAVIQPIPSMDPDVGMETETYESVDAPLVTVPVEVEAVAAPRILYAYPAVYAQPPAPGSASRAIYRRANQPAHGGYTYVYESSVPVLPAGGRVVSFDREAWLDECRRRIAPVEYYEEDGRGEVAGALIGTVAGGVIGNRVAGRGNRTIGTLAGAGLGALAGAAIGDSLDDRTVAVEGEDASGQCEAYLDGYMESARTGGLHGQASATGEYMLVPVTVMVPQRAVYSDGTPFER